MKRSSFRFIIGISLILFIFSASLFCWQLSGRFHSNQPIDSSRFSDFGSFMAGVFGFINFILLIYVYKEGKDQSFNTFFFNHLQVHDSIVTQLRFNKEGINTLNDDSQKLFDGNGLYKSLPEGDLRNECNSYQIMSPATDYFEILYRILHIRYKYKKEAIDNFFKDYNWRIGHYLRSFIALLELIQESEVSDSQKSFNARMFQSRCSSDELRLVFYFIISRNENLRIRLAKLFNSLGFYSAIDDFFIKNELDRKYFNSLINK